MLIVKYERKNKRVIYILNHEQYDGLKSGLKESEKVTFIQDCDSSELAGLIVIDGIFEIGIWPQAHDILSEKLIEKIVPIICAEQQTLISTEAPKVITSVKKIVNGRCFPIFIPLCKDRNLIAMVIDREKKPRALQ